MPLTPSFSVSVTADPSAVVITDTSTGSDGAVVGRKINIYDVSNTLFGNSPYDFPNFPGTTSITINPLTKDKALQIVLTWVSNTGAPLYGPISQIYVFTGYAEQFFSGLTRSQASTPSIVADQQFYQNKSTLRVLIDSANLAISNMQSIGNAQNCIELYTPFLQNPNLFF